MTAAKILPAAAVPVAQAVPAQIPGAALGVVTTAGNRAVEMFGLAQSEPDPAPMRRATWFELALLTKVLFRTPTILHLVSQSHFTLDDPLTRATPDLPQYHRVAAAVIINCEIAAWIDKFRDGAAVELRFLRWKFSLQTPVPGAYHHNSQSKQQRDIGASSHAASSARSANRRAIAG